VVTNVAACLPSFGNSLRKIGHPATEGIFVRLKSHGSRGHIFQKCYFWNRDKGVTVVTAWGVLRLRMKERPPYAEDSCEYVE